MTRKASISTQTTTELRGGWSVFTTPPGACECPYQLAESAAPALAGMVPGTLASALRDDPTHPHHHASPDDLDVWYRCIFDADHTSSDTSDATRLVFDGLATIADVWLNGERLLRSDNMYLRHEVDVSALLCPRNDLCIRFASLNRHLESRRPRPRWRSHLVDSQQLRWVRTTLTGRMPGWHQDYKNIHAVGPWRPITLVADRAVRLTSSHVHATLEQSMGVIRADLQLQQLAGKITTAKLVSGDLAAGFDTTPGHDGSISLTGSLKIPGSGALVAAHPRQSAALFRCSAYHRRRGNHRN